ncbi:MAG: TFIIB-type zinc ribbon-containing protein [Clostridiales bacterium]|nr:TFIIB-type zinc ribbon-containing protein [Clostridiales bacterium]
MENVNTAATVINPNSESADNRKCPSCGATLKFDPATGGLSCEFCGRSVDIHQQIQPPGVGYSLEDLNTHAGAHYLQQAKIVCCATCGGKFILTAQSIAANCPYCGSNSLNETDDVTGMLEPTGVLPFKISKDEATKIFENWIAKQRFSPADLLTKARAAGFVGVYVPYWVFDANTYSAYSGKFGYTYGSGDDEYTKWETRSGVFKLDVKGETIIASQRLAGDSMWNSVSEFNMNLMRKYDPDLLAGFVAERYSIDGPAAWLTAKDRIRGKIKIGIINRESADRVGEIKFEPEYSNVRAKYCLAPVWVTSFKYNDQVYQVLVNGQSGEVRGRSPKSMRFLLRILMIIGIVMGGLLTMRMIMYFIAWIMQMR